MAAISDPENQPRETEQPDFNLETQEAPMEQPVPAGPRRAFAGALLGAVISEGSLPAHIPGEPSHLQAERAAAELAPPLIDALSDLYAIHEWDAAAFRRAFLDGAVRGWRPDARITERPQSLTIVSGTCPVGSQASLDPRVCQLCRALHFNVARAALGEQATNARFEERIARGDGTCHLTIDIQWSEHA